MTRRGLAALFLGLLLSTSAACTPGNDASDPFAWRELPELPLAAGGAFAGEAGGSLLAAGGSRFPSGPPWEGGTKEWLDSVFVLPAGAEQWIPAGRLPEARGNGASFSVPEGVVVAGGINATGHTDAVLLLRWQQDHLEIEQLPSLPGPVGNAAGAVLGRTLYLAGGQEAPGSREAGRYFWRLDLDRMDRGWEVLDPWPGPGRILPAMAAQEGAIYLVSGAELRADGEGGVTRRFLTDAYRYDPQSGWKPIADVPHPVVAAPAQAYGASHVLVLGGDTGEHFERQAELGDQHPGFSTDILAYHTITDTWATLGTIPAPGQVTTPLVAHQGGFVLPSGEDRPAHRTARVLYGQPVSTASGLGGFDIAAIAAYFLILAGIGFYFARRERDDEDYFLAGGRIPAWAAGASIFGTQLSAITFMAIPAKAYATDWVYLLAQASIVLVAPLVVFLYLPFFRRLHVHTAYEYLERRFNLAVRLFASLAFILMQVGRMAIVIFLPAVALSTVAGFNIYLAVLLMGVVTTLYCTVGGIEAVVWTDVMQVIVLMGGALLALAVMVGSIDGGLPAMVSTAVAEGKLHTFTWTWDHTTTAVWVVLVGNLFANLIPYTADQAVVQRYLTTKDEAASARSIWTNALLTVPASLIFFGLGTALFVFYRQHPEQLDPTLPTDAIFPLFIVDQLPAGLTGLLIAGLFAAAMSTLSSSMNSVSQAIVTDFYRRLVPDTTERSRLRLGQGLTVVLGLIGTGGGVLLASLPVVSLWDLFLEMLGLLGGSLAGLFALGIFTRRAHGAGAFVGAVAGAGTLWWVRGSTDLHFFLYAAVGILTTVVVGYLASLLLPAAPRPLEGLTIHDMRRAGSLPEGSAAHHPHPAARAPHQTTTVQ